jgi:hypothetical protein
MLSVLSLDYDGRPPLQYTLEVNLTTDQSIIYHHSKLRRLHSPLRVYDTLPWHRFHGVKVAAWGLPDAMRTGGKLIIKTLKLKAYCSPLGTTNTTYISSSAGSYRLLVSFPLSFPAIYRVRNVTSVTMRSAWAIRVYANVVAGIVGKEVASTT